MNVSNAAAAVNRFSDEDWRLATVRWANVFLAKRLAAAGIPVFPCSPDKKPYVKWRDQSTTDSATIRAWWLQWIDAIVGIDLAKCGLIVVDADRHDPAKDGVKAFAELWNANEDSDNPHPIIRTPRNGEHHVFKQQDGQVLGNARGALPDGIDMRGSGGYVIAAGCVTEQGAWVADPDAPDFLESFKANTIPPLPDWLADIIRTKPEKAAPRPSSGRTGASDEQAGWPQLCPRHAGQAPQRIGEHTGRRSQRGAERQNLPHRAHGRRRLDCQIQG